MCALLLSLMECVVKRCALDFRQVRCELRCRLQYRFEGGAAAQLQAADYLVLVLGDLQSRTAEAAEATRLRSASASLKSREWMAPRSLEA